LARHTRLDLDRISSEFGISRTPIREALLELSFQVMVEIAPRSSVTVIGVSPEATFDNFAILAALSGKAAERAAERISDDEIVELERLAVLLGPSHSGQDMVDTNWQFHRVINRAARSRQLLGLLGQAVRLIPSNFLEVMPVHNNSEHEQLLQAVRGGQPRRARVIAERHVLEAGRSLADWLKQADNVLRATAPTLP
jgi:DNA-binding GntR family transcriptional regulator